MSDYFTILITLLCQADQTAVKCALKIRRDILPIGADQYYMERENRLMIHSLLPAHLRSIGPIVDIDPIADLDIVGPDNVCLWIEGWEDSIYKTTCGKSWYFETGDIRENNVKYCPFCGGEVTTGAGKDE